MKRTPTKSGRVRLSAAQGYRDENGKSGQRTVATFVFVDELEAEFADPVAHLRDVVARVDAERLDGETPRTIDVHS